MPNMIETRINYDLIHLEIEIWYARHRAMEPFIIMNRETLKLLAADSPIANKVTAGKMDGDVAMLYGIKVAICNGLALGEFKIR